jgi:hypothetical protein
VLRWIERGTRGRVSILALGMLLASCPAGAAVAQDAPRGYDEGLFELVAADLPSTTLPVLVSPRGTFLLPAHALLTALGVPHTIQRDSAQLRVTRASPVTDVVLQWRGPDSAEVVATDLDVWIPAPRLAQLVEGVIDVDLASLTVHASKPGGFPAQQREETHRRRTDALRRAALDAPVKLSPVRFEPRTGFGVAEWSVGGPMTPLAAPTSVDTRLGMGVYGGMLKTHLVFAFPSSPGANAATDVEASFLRVFPEGRWLKQLQVGDIVSDGAEARAIRGLTFTNAPFIRDLEYGQVPFSRPLPEGWEYEVYEGDRLVGFSDGTSRAPMTVPLRYGTTPLRVRLYGPAGEVTESAVTYVIPVEQLQAGEWQYGAGAGRCALDQCDALWYGDVRHGFGRRLTMQLGVDGLRDSANAERHVYGAASVVPAAGWALGVQARERAYLRGTITHEGDDPVIGTLSGGLNAAGQGGIGAPITDAGVWFVSSSLRLMHLLPRQGDRGVSVGGRYERDRAGLGERWDVSLTTPVRRGLLEVGLQSDPATELSPDSAHAPLVRIAPSISLDARRLHRLGVPILRVEGGFQGVRLVQWESALSLQSGFGFANVSLRKLHGLPGTQLVVGGTIVTGAARVLTRLTSRSGHADGGYSATGAVAFGSVRRATPLAYGGLGYSGVEGRVFQDLDGDGAFSDGDRTVAGAVIRLGGLQVTTDSGGRYSSWSATPYERIEVQLDTLSLQDPSWVPAVASHALRPSPQQFSNVTFPLVHTRELLGRLVADSTMPAPAGVSLELRDSTTGALYRTRTFGDGGFYVSRMRPGRYTLTVSASSLVVLGAEQPVTVVVVPADGDEAIEIAPIPLHPARPPS